MESAMLYRASGLALLLGAVLVGISTALSFTPPLQSMTSLLLVITLMRNIGALLLLMGLPGIFARQARRAGWLGFAGFTLTFIGWFLYTSYFFITTLLFLPWLAQVAPKQAAACSMMGGCSIGNGLSAFFIFFLVAGILFALGGILLGIAIMRAGILPRRSGLLLLLGLILTPISFFPPNGIISAIVDILVFVLPILVFLLPALAFGWIGYSLMSTASVEAVQPPPTSP